jgi:hypothetical protein
MDDIFGTHTHYRELAGAVSPVEELTKLAQPPLEAAARDCRVQVVLIFRAAVRCVDSRSRHG